MNEQSCARQVTLSGRSRTIGKTTTQQKPMIRIVHLIPPEIIKTDADNFRELVQRLTGKQQPRTNCAHAAKARISKLCRRNKISAAPSSSEMTMTSMTVVGHDDRRILPPTETRAKGVDIAHGKPAMGHDEGEEDGKMHESEIWMQGDDELVTVTATATSGGLGDVEGLFFNVSPLMLNPVISSSASSSMMGDVHAAAAWRIEEAGDR